MKGFVVLLLWALAGLSAGNVFPGENWNSGWVDLGNGGDKIFYILFRARNKNASAPLVLYLAGGPGTSGEYNILLENGPYIVNTQAKFVRNEHAWNNKYDVVFIDQPVGVGFSKAKDYESSCKEKICVVSNMYRFLQGFYEEYPEYKGRPLYTSGVSYAGHYVPGISAYLIQKANPHINFKGAFIGGPWMDADVQMYFDSYYLYVTKRFNVLEYLFFTFTSLICRVQFISDKDNAYDLCSGINSQKDNYASSKNRVNIKDVEEYKSVGQEVLRFWNAEQTQRELGVFNTTYQIKNSTAGSLLRRYDWLVKYTYDIAFILDSKFPVTLMNGDLDYTCQYFGGLAAVEEMQWYGKDKFLEAQWEKQGSETERRKADNFTFYKVFGAGHLIPRDQPKVASKLLDEFISQYP